MRWTSALAISVGKVPGAIQFSRMPRSAHSTARLCDMTLMPAFDMALGTVKAEPFQTQVARMERTEAGTCSAIQRLPQASVTANEPRKTMFEMASKPRIDRSSVRLTKLPAALLTSPVSAPPLAQMRSSISSIASGLRMSQARPVILPPC